ncbi:hypothetical protein QFC20_007182 [Naganishia adeliensis]|uniref:Uncharacterized protein n=1 Tax=Naganishia adeliensis TaxID=92952 RepID=A0ACC2V272_9TREE|nr:hypothetical protein QFC20_007182 [Naganishia adeliensis]
MELPAASPSSTAKSSSSAKPISPNSPRVKSTCLCVTSDQIPSCRKAGRRGGEGQRRCAALQDKLDSISREHGEAYIIGVQPAFEPLKGRLFDSSWNWVRQDAPTVFYDIVFGRLATVDRKETSRRIDIMNRADPTLIQYTQYYVDKCLPEKGETYKLAKEFRQHLIDNCMEAADASEGAYTDYPSSANQGYDVAPHHDVLNLTCPACGELRLARLEDPSADIWHHRQLTFLPRLRTGQVFRGTTGGSRLTAADTSTTRGERRRSSARMEAQPSSPATSTVASFPLAADQTRTAAASGVDVERASVSKSSLARAFRKPEFLLDRSSQSARSLRTSHQEVQR